MSAKQSVVARHPKAQATRGIADGKSRFRIEQHNGPFHNGRKTFRRALSGWFDTEAAAWDDALARDIKEAS